MIDLEQFVIGVSIGSALLLLGLVPGLFQGLTEGVRNALVAFHNRNPLSPRFQFHPDWHAQTSQPKWLAATGAALMAVTMLAYF